MAEIEKKAKPGELGTFEYGTDANAGFENTTTDDYSMPFIAVLQALSPQINKKEERIEGAKVGMLFNTVTEELMDGDKGFEFVPVHREQVFVEWKPRANGGGYIGKHELKSQLVLDAQAANRRNDKDTLLTKDKNELMQTAYIYGLIVHEDGRNPEPVVLAFTSTKLRVYRHFMTKVNQFQILTSKGKKETPPLFGHRLRVTTTEQSNQHGTFYNFVLAPLNGDRENSLLDPRSDLYALAKKLAESIRTGVAKVNYDSQDGGDSSSGGHGDDDIPFA